MGKLEKAIKIHMLFGLFFIIAFGLPSGVQYYTVPFAFTLYPPVNIVYWLWAFWSHLYTRSPQMSQIWFWMTPLVIIATECVEWYALRVLKKRKAIQSK